LIDRIIGTTQKIKGKPSSYIQKKAGIKTWWYSKIVLINEGTQVVKTNPRKTANENVYTH
jgi:hypothetical protein